MEVGRTSQPLTALLRPPTGRAQGQEPKRETQAAGAPAEVEQPRPLALPAEPRLAEEAKATGNQERSPVEELQQAVEELNAKVSESKQTQIKFTVDSESGSVIVQIVDKESEEVIRQIPPEEMVALRRRMAEMRGILFNAQG